MSVIASLIVLMIAMQKKFKALSVTVKGIFSVAAILYTYT